MRAILFSLAVAICARAETGRDAWLRYAPVDGAALPAIPAVVATLGASALEASAQQELIRGLRGMLGRVPRAQAGLPSENALLLGTLDELANAAPQLHLTADLPTDGFWLKTAEAGTCRYTIVTAPNDRGVLYGAFALLRRIALGEAIDRLDERQSPYAPIRWVNQWDNLSGTIERGYGGRSIFWDNGRVREDLGRAADYGRLLASLGINGCAINNVNADRRLLTAEMLAQATRIAGVLRPWGVRTVLAVDLGSPKTLGGLDTFDPLDPRVAAWWKSKTDQVYAAIPDLAGFEMKADSEGRAGPSSYGRTHADAANVVARALRPHGGLILYRAFVYDRHLDWRNPKNDRARAAYDNFHGLDGQFDDNVVVQIKNGPIDFQVREPVSPLFAALAKTNQVAELQVTQEYMGQARHTVFLVPLWKDTLDFDLRAGGASTPVKALAAGRTFHRPAGGFIGVANWGLDDNWTGNQLSQANLYGFGRLAWNPDLDARQIAGEWIGLTFGGDRAVAETISGILLTSWRTYENYTGPLGLQTLTDITGNHYGVAVEASERNGWGQWHHADERGAGMDRSVATGTGFAGQYPADVARLYDSPATCPDDLLLFFHHVPYTHRLHSGRTVIQQIYDLHYEGAAAATDYARAWNSLRGRIDDRRYREILAQLEYQDGQAELWRDAVSNWFHRASGIADDQGRVGHHPGRIEGESMRLDTYAALDVTPWEAASGGKAIVCPASRCGASVRYQGEPGWFTLRIRYFDQNEGAARFRLGINGQLVDEWTADDHLPTRKIDAGASVRRTCGTVALRRGDEIRIEGAPDGADRAAVDYLEILPAGNGATLR